MSSKRVGLPSLNSTSKKDALQPVKVQRYRAGKAPEGYVDPALESSDEEDNEAKDTSARGGRAGGISMSIGSEPPKMAYQVLNVEQMTRERQLEQSQRKDRGGAAGSEPLAAASSDRRLARLQQMQMDSQRSRGDTRSRRARADSDEEEEDEEEKSEDEDDEEEAALLRRKAARARASKVQEEEEELWGQGEEEEEEEEQQAGRKGRSRREGEVSDLNCVSG